MCWVYPAHALLIFPLNKKLGGKYIFYVMLPFSVFAFANVTGVKGREKGEYHAFGNV
jgi:hypothetical protein